MALLQFGNFTNLILYLRIIVPSDPENSTSCILFHSTKPYVHQSEEEFQTLSFSAPLHVFKTQSLCHHIPGE